MPINENIVNRNVHQQAEKSHHHRRFGFGQTFTLVTGYLEEQIPRRAPQQRAQVADGFICQRRVDVMHGANNVSRVPEHDHNQNGDAARQPETLAYLMGNTIAAPGTIELRNHWRQGQQQSVTKQNGRQPDRCANGDGRHVRGAVSARHDGINESHCGLSDLRKNHRNCQS